jgi:streptogramin lyase
LQTRRSFFLPLAATLSIALLTGCSANFRPDPTPNGETPIGTIEGSLHGGQAPIIGAQIFLFAAGTSGYASAATSRLNSTTGLKSTTSPFAGDWYVTTTASGSFSIGGDYTCVPGTQVYLVAYGGDAGYGSNSYIMQMAGLGQCPTAGNLAATVPYVVINEVSTVAFAYAMGAYGTSATNVGSPSTTLGLTGIANAMANVGNILNIGYGQSPTATNANPSGVVPQSRIYTLANLLAACVNTDGTLATKTGGNTTYQPCGTLFRYTVGTSGAGANMTSTGDEAQAIFYMAQNPTSNVANLYGLQTTTSPFLPKLTASPTDWTLPIVYKGVISTFVAANGTTTSGPFNIAFDANGSAWIGDRVKGVVNISPQGAVSTYDYTDAPLNKHAFGMIKGVTVSPSGAIWAADYKNDKIYVMDQSGNIDSTITTGLNGPVAVAFDTPGNAYVANEDGASISIYSSSGAILDNQTAVGVDTPGYISVDADGNAWVPSTDTGNIGELQTVVTTRRGATTTTYTASTLAVQGVNGSYAVVPDSAAAGNLWVGDYSDSQLVQVYNTNSGARAQQTGGGLNGPYHLSVDGNGYIWASNEGAAVVTAWSPNGHNGQMLATNGFTTGTTAGNVAATPDLSGNLWTANTDGSVTQLLGLATPTVAPISPATIGTLP